MRQLKTFETGNLTFEVEIVEEKDKDTKRNVRINGDAIDDYTVSNLIKWLRAEVLGQTGIGTGYAAQGPRMESLSVSDPSKLVAGKDTELVMKVVEDPNKNHLGVAIPSFEDRTAISFTPMKQVRMGDRKAVNSSGPLAEHLRVASMPEEVADLTPRIL